MSPCKGVPKRELTEAVDSDNPREAVIQLLIERSRGRTRRESIYKGTGTGMDISSASVLSAEFESPDNIVKIKFSKDEWDEVRRRKLLMLDVPPVGGNQVEFGQRLIRPTAVVTSVSTYYLADHLQDKVLVKAFMKLKGGMLLVSIDDRVDLDLFQVNEMFAKKTAGVKCELIFIQETTVASHVHGCDSDQGRLKVWVVGAENIPKMDVFSHADPYCFLTFGEGLHRQVGQTRVCFNTGNPFWNAFMEFAVSDSDHANSGCAGDLEGGTLTFEVWDKDRIGNNELIGTAALKLLDVWQQCKSKNQNTPREKKMHSPKPTVFLGIDQRGRPQWKEVVSDIGWHDMHEDGVIGCAAHTNFDDCWYVDVELALQGENCTVKGSRMPPFERQPKIRVKLLYTSTRTRKPNRDIQRLMNSHKFVDISQKLDGEIESPNFKTHENASIRKSPCCRRARSFRFTMCAVVIFRISY
eukprot:SAG31_NODE_1918_length_6921_cov_2.015245_3_plen_468_part_00